MRVVLRSRIRKHPEGSVTSNKEERNSYLLMKYKERLDCMIGNNQVRMENMCDEKVVCDGLTENETLFGMKRLTVSVWCCVDKQTSLFVSSVDYHLENPLWEFVVIHLHKGEYQPLKELGSDRRFHIYVPYFFEESELTQFMKLNLKRLQHLIDVNKTKKLL